MVERAGMPAREVIETELGWLDEQNWEGLSDGERRNLYTNHLMMSLQDAGYDLASSARGDNRG